ncbi:nuclear transport factor 2 family protein [Terricaulis silvestris]|uniref:nuclear transport factor 2 family protein n=1 Tax=Terricaulis silvestris TaxID=2686094 RepID=UPI00131E439D|nr:nuclear transport factor 2 family protein [Terricaulis silvestris]
MSGTEPVVDVETQRAIEALLTEFAYRVDHGQADRVHELFTPDATLSTPAFVLKSRDEIEERFKARAKDTSRRTRHFWSNLHLSREGETIVAVTNAMTVVAPEGVAPLMMGGSSRDVCVERDGRWAFQSRALTMIFEGRLSSEAHP